MITTIIIRLQKIRRTRKDKTKMKFNTILNANIISYYITPNAKTKFRSTYYITLTYLLSLPTSKILIQKWKCRENNIGLYLLFFLQNLRSQQSTIGHSHIDRHR